MTINIPFPASGGSWKTSLSGGILAGLGVLNAYQIHDWHSFIKDPITLGLFVAAIMGLSSKDSDLTGGSRGQSSTPQALLDSNVAPSPVKPPAAPNSSMPLKIT
jgi:hypothetical protein